MNDKRSFANWPVFAALGQSSRRDFDIKVPSLQRRPPDTVRALWATGLKEQEAHSAVGRRRLLKNQQLSILQDRGRVSDDLKNKVPGAPV